LVFFHSRSLVGDCRSGIGGAIFSEATDLVADDTNGVQDAFVRDLDLAINERVSVSSAGEQGNGVSGWAILEGSARYAAYHSAASNLVDDDSNGARDIFARDRTGGTTSLLSFTAAGAQSNDDSTAPTMSADGRLIVFASLASNLVPDDGNGLEDIFIAYGPATTFADGFEAGSTSRWSETVP
jgi:Tol biopolymer transport system component